MRTQPHRRERWAGIRHIGTLHLYATTPEYPAGLGIGFSFQVQSGNRLSKESEGDQLQPNEERGTGRGSGVPLP